MTSIEWLINKLGISEITHKKLFEQAKEMHKQEIINAYKEGTKLIDVEDELSAEFNGVLYFYETYNK